MTKGMKKLNQSKALRVLFAAMLILGLVPVAATFSNTSTAFAASNFYVGQEFSGNANIGNTWKVDEQSYFTVDGFTGELSDVGSVTLHCLDHTAAAPPPQTAPYVATITSIDMPTGAVVMSVVITPKNATDGVTWDPRGWLTGYQHVGGEVTVHRPFPGWIDLQKSSSNTAISDGNDCYSLEGAQYGVYKDTACTDKVTTLTTNADGYAKSDDLPIGTYYVKETTNPKGFDNDSKIYTVNVNAGETVRVNSSDKPLNDPMRMILQKYDGEKSYSANNLPTGSASLAGARYTVKYYDVTAYAPTDVDGVTQNELPLRTWEFQTDDKGRIRFSEATNYYIGGDALYYSPNGNAIFPLGTYVYYESEGGQPEGYLHSDAKYMQVIKQAGDGSTAVINSIADDTVKAAEQVKRNNLAFVKANGLTQERMAGIPFKITSATTGESHIVVTDANGVFSSSAAAHSKNTNANDNATDTDGDGYVNYSADCGVWFGLDNDGKTTAAKDNLGALPYDTYTIEELACAANEGLQLVSAKVMISKDTSEADAVNIGTLDDPEPVIDTFATDKADGDKFVAQDNEVTVVDRVNYANMIPNRTYTFQSELVDVTDGDKVVATVTTDFTPTSSNGFVNIDLTANTRSLADHRLVVYQTIICDGRVLVEHKDSSDTDQMVQVQATPNGSSYDKTGMDIALASLIATLALLAAGAGIYGCRARKNALANAGNDADASEVNG